MHVQETLQLAPSGWPKKGELLDWYTDTASEDKDTQRAVGGERLPF